MPPETVIGWDTVDACLADGIEELLAAHWEEIADDRDVIPYAPDFDSYRADEQAKRFRIITARRGRSILAYNAFFVMVHRHYRRTLFALNDIVYVDPAERRAGLGLRLVSETEALLKSIGVVKVLYHCKESDEERKLQALLGRMGYLHAESTMGKIIGA